MAKDWLDWEMSQVVFADERLSPRPVAGTSIARISWPWSRGWVGVCPLVTVSIEISEFARARTGVEGPSSADAICFSLPSPLDRLTFNKSRGPDAICSALSTAGFVSPAVSPAWPVRPETDPEPSEFHFVG